jgi:hypothetical protein
VAAAKPAKKPAPDLGTVVTDAVNEAADDVVAGVNTVVKPQAAATVANSFSFPLALMVIVVLFLIVQPRVDRRDPRLRALSAASDDREIGFLDEDLL